jgi:hypothetical protein
MSNYLWDMSMYLWDKFHFIIIIVTRTIEW